MIKLSWITFIFAVSADDKAEKTAQHLLSLIETLCTVPHTETCMFDDRIWQCHTDLYGLSHIPFKYVWVVYAAIPFQGAVWGHGKLNRTVCKF